MDRFDILIVPGDPAFRIADRGARALLSFFHRAQLFSVGDVDADDDQTRVALLPAHFSHHLFYEGERVPGELFAAAELRFGSALGTPPFGSTVACGVWISIHRAALPVVHESIVDRLQQILYMRPKVIAVPR